MSERLDAEELTSLVNRFFTLMTERILANGGTIDKYIGDCVMAFWNAPLDDPDHARHACLTALAMKRALGEFNAALAREAADAGRPYEPLGVGIGINTGVCCVGNTGSEQRFDYSALGDEVNLASRLEGQTKAFGVDIVLSDHTESRLDGLATLELDLIRVRGRHAPTRIFTVLGDDAFAHSDDYRGLRQAHDALIAAYRERDWARAREHLALCRRRGADLGLSALYEIYEQRLAACERTPPGPDWDGVFGPATG